VDPVSGSKAFPVAVTDLQDEGWSSTSPYLADSDTVVCSPHKGYGPEPNNLVLQLRKRGISQVLLAGMSANLCLESHLRELLEQGLEAAVVSAATAAAQHPDMGDGHAAALADFGYIAGDVLTTEQAVTSLAG
jgi:nicotinamidase-related amidase